MNEENDAERIHGQQSDLGPSHTAQQFIKLDGNVEGSAYCAQPLSPASMMPKTKSLEQSQDGIRKGSASQQPKGRVIPLGGSLYEYPWKPAGWIEVKVPHQFLRHALSVMVYQPEHAKASEQHEDSFGCFEERNEANALSHVTHQMVGHSAALKPEIEMPNIVNRITHAFFYMNSKTITKPEKTTRVRDTRNTTSMMAAHLSFATGFTLRSAKNIR